MLGPELELTETQGRAIARGLVTVARCDGSFDSREKALIDDLVPDAPEALADIGPDEIAKALSGEAARLFLRSCFLVALADRHFSDKERSVIEGYANALGVESEELSTLGQSVKEYLLSPLSRLSNTAGVAEVSKKLTV
jgi:tellurite resistance protein